MNVVDDFGHTALSRACSEGHTDVVRELLDRGADPELGEYKPLVEAAESGKLEIVRLLIVKGNVSNVFYLCCCCFIALVLISSLSLKHVFPETRIPPGQKYV